MNGKYLLAVFSIVMFAWNALADTPAITKLLRNPFLEFGYAKAIHSSKLNHFENLDFDLSTSSEIQGYRKRKLRNGNAFYIQIGVRPYEKIRFGFEYIQTGKNKLRVINHIQSTDQFDSYKLFTDHKAVLFNLNYHPIDWKGFSPYFGASIGISRNKVSKEMINLNYIVGPEVDGERLKRVVNRFAWSLQAGMQYKLFHQIYANASYKFIDFGSVGSSSEYSYNMGNTEEGLPINLKGHLRSHALMFGLGYQF